MIAAHAAQTVDGGSEFVRTLLGLLGTYLALVLALLALWLWVVVRMVRRVTVRLDDDGLRALRSVPLALPLAIDAIDLGLDLFGAPLAWFVSNRTALKPLRGASLLEALVPGTQFLPLLTIGWWWANHVRRDGPWPGGAPGGVRVVDGGRIVEGAPIADGAVVVDVEPVRDAPPERLSDGR